MNTKTKNSAVAQTQTGGLFHTADFESRCPRGVRFLQFRYDKGLVTYARAIVAELSLEVLYTSDGTAYVRSKVGRQADVARVTHSRMCLRFNGYIYYRCNKYDLQLRDGQSEAV